LQFAGRDLLGLPEREMREIRGRRMTMVMQDPRYCLNPVLKVGNQLAEACRAHSTMGKAEAWQKAVDMLDVVQIRNPARMAEYYPHELSGGMGQRVMIAMMLIPNPDLLIADEPTSALDVTVQRQILHLLDRLVAQRRMSLVFISHDLNLVSEFCDRILIMYRGRIVESCAADQLHVARHPYTRGLLDCAPSMDRKVDRLNVLVRDPAWER
jgi:peptide/nickel transport system ATP-binding protein